MVQMRYFTWYSWLAILGLSIGIYYAFMWACNWLSPSKTYATILEMHKSPLYYLTVGLCVMICFAVDLFLKGVSFNILTSPSDYLRSVVSSGSRFLTDDGEYEFNAIYAKIKTYYVQEDIKREAYLEMRREELARLVADQKL